MIKRQGVAWRWKPKEPDALASVYIHTVPNGRIYIGVTCRDPEARWQRNGSGYRKQKEFFADIQKYGWDNIKHEILFQSKDTNEAYAKEEEFIRLYKEKYGDLVYNVTFGRMHTDSYKQLISKLNKGKTVDASTRKKLSDARVSKHGTSVVCWETGEIFPSMKSAGDFCGVSRFGNILSACNLFPNRTLGGYHWYFANEDMSEKEIPLIKAATLPVRCVETGKIFPSSNDAAKSIHYTHPLRIVMSCDGANKKVARHTWEWVTNV